jgi:L-seryl-tRNA(Ser) seleniumtransferase
MLKPICDNICKLDIVDTTSRVGGGAMPEQGIPSIAVAIKPKSFSVGKLEKLLREQPVPIIGRVEHERLLLDMRTVAEDEVPLIVDSLVAVINGPTTSSVGI